MPNVYTVWQLTMDTLSDGSPWHSAVSVHIHRQAPETPFKVCKLCILSISYTRHDVIFFKPQSEQLLPYTGSTQNYFHESIFNLLMFWADFTSTILLYFPDRNHSKEASCCTEFLDDKSITLHSTQGDSNIEFSIILQIFKKHQQIFHLVAI